jgi:hypothetical protein
MMSKALKKATGKYDKRSAKFGFSEWSLMQEPEIQEAFNKIIKIACDIATEEYKCDAWFPIEWGETDGVGGKPPKDPTTIYVDLPLGPDEDDNPRWSFTLSELVEKMIENHEEGGGGPISGPQERMSLAVVRDDLRWLAGVLDEALDR